MSGFPGGGGRGGRGGRGGGRGGYGMGPGADTAHLRQDHFNLIVLLNLAHIPSSGAHWWYIHLCANSPVFYPHIYMCMLHVCLNLRLFVCVFVFLVCIFAVCSYVCTDVCTRVCTPACMYDYMNTCIHALIYTSVYTLTHAHTYLRAASRLQRLPGPLTSEKLDGGDAHLRERIIKVQTKK